MNTPKLFLALTSALFAISTAHAQVGAYGTVTVRRMTNIPFTQGTTTFTNGSFDPVGATGGVYYDFRTLGPVRLGADVRGGVTNGTQSAYTNFIAGGGHLASGLGGVRAVFHTPFLPIRPYVEGMVGVARTNFGTDYNQSIITSTLSKQTGVLVSTHLEYDAFAGVDYAILPIVDFRVELGYGAVEGTSHAFPTSHTYPVQSISTGIVFHLPFGLGKIR